MPLPVLTLTPGAFGRRPVPARFTLGMYHAQHPRFQDGRIVAPFPVVFTVRDPAQRHGVRVRVVRVGIDRAAPPQAPAGVHMVASGEHWAIWVAEVVRVRPARRPRPKGTKGRAG